MRITVFDLEMSNLSANFGIVLCGGFKSIYEDKKVVVHRIDDFKRYEKAPWDDSRVIAACRDELAKADILVSYNGKRFDVPFLNARLIKHGLPILPRMKHVDLFFTSIFDLKLSNKSLDTIAKFLGCKEEKTRMEGEQWVKAMTGEKKSMQYIIDHCVLDVQVLEEVFMKVKSTIKMIKE